MIRTSPVTFLDLALELDAAVLQAEVLRSEFGDRFARLGSAVEFDLLLWSLAQRMRLDTEELLRLIGERWCASLPPSVSAEPLEALQALFTGASAFLEAPVPGIESFSINSASLSGGRLKVICRGARRCCSFFEGVARARVAACGYTLRYLRQPRRANCVTITFSCAPIA